MYMKLKLLKKLLVNEVKLAYIFMGMKLHQIFFITLFVGSKAKLDVNLTLAIHNCIRYYT